MATIPKVSVIGRKEAIAKAVKIDLIPLGDLVVSSSEFRIRNFLNRRRKSISRTYSLAAKLSALRECITSIRYAAQGPNAISTF